MEKIKSFKELKIWQKGMEIVKDIYTATGKFPKEELYGLTSQMRRSAVAIPSNVAEGFKRYHSKEYRYFLHIVLGTAAELETQVILSKELGMMHRDHSEVISEKLDHFARMVASLVRKLNEAKPDGRSTKYEGRKTGLL